MKITAGTLITALFGTASATMRGRNGTPLKVKENFDVERQLSGSGDMAVNFGQLDDDGSSGVNTARYSWYTSKEKSVDWSTYNLMPKKCMMS
jgi:hypothetical protein